jgi:hypothetical protein
VQRSPAACYPWARPEREPKAIRQRLFDYPLCDTSRGPLITADKSDNIRTSSWYLSTERGTEAGTCTLICAKVQSEWSAVQSQIENYQAKAKEFARLSVIAKSLRHSRQYRKLAEMDWALALGEEPKRAEPSKIHVERTT